MHRGQKPTHGMSQSLEYSSWTAMKKRCYYPKTNDYARYGGSGITVCDRWRYSFENFYADMGHRPSLAHSLDRIDGTGNYEPGNVRWATGSEQARNRVKPPKPMVSLQCIVCEKAFTRSEYDFKRYRGRFCSNSCTAKHHRRTWVNSGHQLINVVCKICGKGFTRTPYHAARRQTMSCSVKCRVILKKAIQNCG